MAHSSFSKRHGTIGSNKEKELLVAGYVRRIEENLCNDQIIPNGITLLCRAFYSRNIYLFFLSENLSKYAKGLYIANLNDSTNTNHCNVFQLDTASNTTELVTSSKYQKRPNTKWVVFNSGICTQQNMQIPDIIHDQVCRQSASKTNIGNNYNVIFKCCGNHDGMMKYCSAILINNNQKSEELNGFNWDLPEYVQPVDFNVATFSNKYNTLYNIGGWQNNKIGELSFNNNEYIDIGWQLLTKMDSIRSSPAVTLINSNNTDSGKQGLIVIGGYIGNYRWDKKVNLYDFQGKKWIKCTESSIGQYGGNAYWDKITNNVYFGGGDQSKGRVSIKGKSCMEYLKIDKNVWIKLADTNIAHKSKPILWTEDVNMLFISSPASNWIECIDIRENTKSWDKLYRLDQVFGINAPNIASKAQLIV